MGLGGMPALKQSISTTLWGGNCVPNITNYELRVCTRVCVLHNGGDKKLVVFEYLIYRTEDNNDGSTLLQIVSFLTGVVFFTERFSALLR